MKFRALILNDTDIDGQHFGCERVMNVIKDNLRSRNLEIIGSLPVGVPWNKSASSLNKFNAAHIVVINGEGTLHHGKPKARLLLEAAEHFKRCGKKVYLINALWQKNPRSWFELAKNFDKIWCRDSFSAKELSTYFEQPIKWHGDLSLYASQLPDFSNDREGIIVGDSVSASLTRKLWNFQKTFCPDAKIVPVLKQACFIAPHTGTLRTVLRKWKNSVFTKKNIRDTPNLLYLNDEKHYREVISNACLSVTGRFHAVSLAILTGTPFVAVDSNSHKIKALLNDVGLSPERLISNNLLKTDIFSGYNWNYSEAEKKNIRHNLRTWQIASDEMFDEISRNF